MVSAEFGLQDGSLQSLGPGKHRQQETKDEDETVAGKVVFLPAFRNLPAILYVPMLEQNFILGS
jgi:hypothetical protein